MSTFGAQHVCLSSSHGRSRSGQRSNLPFLSLLATEPSRGVPKAPVPLGVATTYDCPRSVVDKRLSQFFKSSYDWLLIWRTSLQTSRGHFGRQEVFDDALKTSWRPIWSQRIREKTQQAFHCSLVGGRVSWRVSHDRFRWWWAVGSGRRTYASRR